VETSSGLLLGGLEDAMPAVDDHQKLRSLALRDGYLFLRGLLPPDLVLGLRRVIVEYAIEARWAESAGESGEARAMPGKRIGYYEDPEWVEFQARVQNRREFWSLGEFPGIHQVLDAIADQASFLCLNTANTCRVVSPHPDITTQPHQDANYVSFLDNFWTAWAPLGDCPMELGPLAVLAGSHRHGVDKHTGRGIVDGGIAVSPEAVWLTSDFQCGDILLFTQFTIHRGLPNMSGDRLRFSADFRYGFWNG
jgi:ectoine hydroxylase-related dioxygenase (phytanoyl-CoA dioxygenase family)